jgi:hypothetical protein
MQSKSHVLTIVILLDFTDDNEKVFKKGVWTFIVGKKSAYLRCGFS